MKKCILPFLALALVSCSVAKELPKSYPVISEESVSHTGTLKSLTYPTSVPGPAERRLYAYLPQGYENTDERYPVVYLLHGARGDEASWISQGGILSKIDSLYSIGAIPKMIIVFPNMNSYDSEADYAKSRHKGALESFFEVDGVVESSFVYDVVKAVDLQLRTKASRDHRAIAGLSLGGMQSVHISATWPEKFRSVGVFSAPLHSALRKGPYSAFYDGLEKELFVLKPSQRPGYSIYVGKKDVYKKTMEKFRDKLLASGYDCFFLLDSGGHQWPQWISFVTDYLQKLAGIFPKN